MLRTAAVVPLLVFGALWSIACSDDPTAERTEFIRDAEAEIERLRADLEEMRDDVATGDAARDIEAEAGRLQERINAAEARLQQIREAPEEEWRALRRDLETALEDADDAAREIARDLGLD